jgi:hypothetical protein
MGETNAAEFTNPDVRLRPLQALDVNIPSHGPREYAVTEKTFPQLAEAWDKIQKAAGLEGYHVVILGDNFGGAGSDWDRKLIGIGIRMINTTPFDGIVGTLGHEAGHMWRHQHPNAPFTGNTVAGLGDKQLIEIEADRLGSCLTGAGPAITGLQSGGKTMDEKLPVQLRIDAIEQFSPSSCPMKPADLKLNR